MLRIPAPASAPPPASTPGMPGATDASGWPLFDTAATRALEHQWAARLPAHALMQRAGLAVARLARALAPHARTFWIACGPGNNGGDGLQAAAQLRQSLAPACRVAVSCTREREHMPADARAAWDAARRAGVQWVEHMPAGMGPQDLCIDALLGIGLKPDGPGQARGPSATAAGTTALATLLRSLHDSPSPVLCVDVASGLDADNGQYLPGFAPGDRHDASGHGTSARHTLALLTLHPGLFTGQGRDACGQVWWDDLGTGLQSGSGATPAPLPACARLFWPRPAHRRARAHASHKGSFGDVAVIGGEGLAHRGLSMTGAAWLAALAALHGGAGRVMLALLDAAPGQPPDSQAISPWPEIMLRRPQAQDWQHATVVCGCGGGMAVRPWLAQILAQAPRLVLDADGLNAVAEDAQLAAALRQRRERGQHTILTPHPLEAARLLRRTTAQVQAVRLDAARELATQLQCTVLLKGSGTVVAEPADGQGGAEPACFINPTGNALLSTGGTGDVLAGLIGALWAQGHAPAQAAALAAHRHGAAADHWPPGRPFSAGALAEHLGST